MRIRLAACLFVLFSAQSALADDCAHLFLGGRAPAFTGPQPARRTPLCFTAFAVTVSGQVRLPLWSAEHLTADYAAKAPHTPRPSGFHPEEALPADDRAYPRDYTRQFDRGHMTPAGDVASRRAKTETFSMANVVPQTAALNRGVWEGIESAVRKLAERDGEVYIVTGPQIAPHDAWTENGRVMVPTATWKAVWDPAAGTGGAWLCSNTMAPDCRVLSFAALTAVVRINPFPALSDAQDRAAPVLPTPEPSRFWPPRYAETGSEARAN